MTFDPKSKADCEKLIQKIRETLRGTGFDLAKIREEVPPFAEDNARVLEALCRAILSSRAVSESIKPNLPAINKLLLDYDATRLARLSDGELDELYEHGFKPLGIQSQQLREKLKWMRDSARTFQRIEETEEIPVWRFIKNRRDENRTSELTESFTKPESPRKLSGVGKQICREFFKNIGIDALKDDVHVTRFLRRIGAVKSDEPEETVKIGAMIAKALGKPLIYVDSHIWNFCASRKGEICTERNPKCHICKLRIEEPVLCAWTTSSRVGSYSAELNTKRKGGTMMRDTERLPVREARGFVLGKGLTEEVQFIESPDFGESASRRCLYAELLFRNKCWGEFKQKRWPNGNTQKSRERLKANKSLMEKALTRARKTPPWQPLTEEEWEALINSGPSEPDKTTKSPPGQTPPANDNSIVICLPPSAARQLEAIAREMDDSPSTLAKRWIIERLLQLR